MSKEFFWNLVKKEMSDDFVHGLPHAERVYKFFKILKSESKLPKEILEALEIAVICHDIGRGKCGARSHAEVSAEKMHALLNSIELARSSEANAVSFASKKEFPEETKRLIEFAVAQHSQGLKTNWKNYREAILGLLTYLDHLDALGSVGIARAFIFCKIPVYPAKFSKLKVIPILRHPKTITSGDIGMKNKSILEHLIFNYCITWNLRKRVDDLIPKKVRKVEKEKLDTMKNFILNMIEGDKQ